YDISKELIDVLRTNRNDNVRYAVAVIMGETALTEDGCLDEDIEHALDDPDEMVREGVARALGDIDYVWNADSAALLPMSRRREVRIQETRIKGLCYLLAKENSPLVRDRVIRALESHDGL